MFLRNVGNHLQYYTVSQLRSLKSTGYEMNGKWEKISVRPYFYLRNYRSNSIKLLLVFALYLLQRIVSHVSQILLYIKPN
jgi:hypothetical protein